MTNSTAMGGCSRLASHLMSPTLKSAAPLMPRATAHASAETGKRCSRSTTRGSMRIGSASKASIAAMTVHNAGLCNQPTGAVILVKQAPHRVVALCPLSRMEETHRSFGYSIIAMRSLPSAGGRKPTAGVAVCCCRFHRVALPTIAEANGPSIPPRRHLPICGAGPRSGGESAARDSPLCFCALAHAPSGRSSEQP